MIKDEYTFSNQISMLKKTEIRSEDGREDASICKPGHGEADSMYIKGKAEYLHAYLSDNMI